MKVHTLPSGSVVYGKLPLGCRLCQEGLKTVVFLTGLCPLHCFYCPLSRERKNRDVIYVNEVETSEEALARVLASEVLRSASRGASITGGEPFVKLSRAVQVISFLKEKFGRNFHVHLYTSGALLTRENLGRLVEAGLDELRIHAPVPILEEKLKVAREYADELAMGLEYPALPGGEGELLRLVELAEKYELQFVNLNELELTETNYPSLLLRGYRMKKDYRGAENSRDTALKIVRAAEERGYGVSVHFCPVSVKDSQQTGLRYYRAGVLAARPYHFVTDEGTVLEAAYEELKPEASEVLGLYPSGLLHFFLSDFIARGRIVERSPLLNWLNVEETPI